MVGREAKITVASLRPEAQMWISLNTKYRARVVFGRLMLLLVSFNGVPSCFQLAFLSLFLSFFLCIRNNNNYTTATIITSNTYLRESL